MRFLRDVSIKHKLTRVVMLTSAVVLLLACVAFGIYDQISYRKIVENELLVMTEAIGSSSVAALEFENPKLGKEVLSDLKAVRRVVAARIYDKGDGVFVSYNRSEKTVFLDPDSPRRDGVYFEGDYILIFQPVALSQQRVGTIYVRARAEDLYYRLREYVIIAVLVFGVSCWLAFLMASKLQTAISGPVLRLAETADRVSAQKNYSIRASKESNDEVGFLIERFNEMLTRVETGDKVLRETMVSRDYVDNILQSMRDCLVVISPDGVIKTVNQATVNVMGYREEELLGRPIGFLFKEGGNFSFDNDALAGLMATGAVGNIEKIWLSKESKELTMRISGAAVRGPNGEAQGIALVATDVTEQKQAERALIWAKEEAERANLAKSEFLARMSHELRTPMNSILGFSELIMSNPTEPLTAGQKEDVTHIMDSGRHLLGLINEVLDLVQIESGNIQIRLEPVAVSDMIENLLALVHPIAEKNHINLTAGGQPDRDYFVVADRVRLKQALLNLLSNAIKYNRRNGFVNVTCREERQGWLRITVHDTGLGIPEEVQPLLFEPFERLGKENSDVGGAGVGLAITKRLVHLMNGFIGYTSTLGEGSSFYLELLVCEVPPKKEEENEVESSAGALAGDKRFTLLYVEDSQDNLNLVKKIIQRRPSIDLISAPDAKIGIDLARVHRPDLILMDINLPGMDGIAAMRDLKKIEETKDIPVIALSGNALKTEVEKALQEGFAYYITKPIKVSAFLETIDAFLDDIK